METHWEPGKSENKQKSPSPTTPPTPKPPWGTHWEPRQHIGNLMGNHMSQDKALSCEEKTKQNKTT
jgi:hypothetical protein